jgi:hypothetical protein
MVGKDIEKLSSGEVGIYTASHGNSTMNGSNTDGGNEGWAVFSDGTNRGGLDNVVIAPLCGCMSAPESCMDGIENDCNTLIDCGNPDCVPSKLCP